MEYFIAIVSAYCFWALGMTMAKINKETVEQESHSGKLAILITIFVLLTVGSIGMFLLVL